MAYYCDKIFSNHVGDEATVKQTVFLRAVLTVILVALCSVTCTLKCHMHSDSDPSASVCVEMLNCRHENLSKVRRSHHIQRRPAADAVKLPGKRLQWFCALWMQMETCQQNLRNSLYTG